MLIAIDIGATKTLVASFSDAPTPLEKKKLPTDTDIDTWHQQTTEAIDDLAGKQQVGQIVVATRGEITDDEQLTITDHKKLDWDRAPIGKKLKDHYKVPTIVHHDTAMGALGESAYGAGKGYGSMLYITISTGIGTAMVIDDLVHKPFTRSAGGDMVTGLSTLSEDARRSTIERRLSGEAMKQRWGKYGYEIQDEATWAAYGAELALALNNMIVLTEPDAVVLAGGVSVHFDKFIPHVRQKLQANTTSPHPLPKIVQAKYVETSVIYGCYAWAQTQDKA